MGIFHGCPRCLRLRLAPPRSSVNDEFNAELFTTDSASQKAEADSEPFLPFDDAVANPWVDVGCDLHCPACLKHLEQDPLALATTWLDACIVDAALAVPRFSDTALYVMAVRILAMVCKAAAERGGVVTVQHIALVTPVYMSTLKLLEASWHNAADWHRCRPFLRLRIGRLLQMKLIVELCFWDAFDTPPHAAGLSGLAIRILVALGEGDTEVLWDAVQLLEDSAKRASIIGPRDDYQSKAACAVLYLQSFTELLVHPLWPLEVYRCPVEQALSRMSAVLADFTAEAPPQVRWLVGWQLIDCADRAFRYSCRSGIDSENGVEFKNVEPVKSWAIHCAMELALWRVGDPYAGTVALAATRALILWHRLLLRQARSLRSDEHLATLTRALHRATAHCTNIIDGSAARSEATAEAKAVMMLLNDHHMATAPQLAAQRPCLLHAHGSEPGSLLDDSVGTLPSQSSGYRLVPVTVEIVGDKLTVRVTDSDSHSADCCQMTSVASLPADGAAAFACLEDLSGGLGSIAPVPIIDNDASVARLCAPLDGEEMAWKSEHQLLQVDIYSEPYDDTASWRSRHTASRSSSPCKTDR